MGIEIERKFLVDPLKLDDMVELDKLERKNIDQGYLITQPTVRIRILDNKKAILGFKTKGTIVKRTEFEREVPLCVGRYMMKLCVYKVHKTRYFYPTLVDDVSCDWEIDQFHGFLEGLWLAEIELPNENTRFVKPSWLGREVTYNTAYQNACLAKQRSW